MHGSDNLDEITITGETKISELVNNAITTYTINPVTLGIDLAKPSDLIGESIEHNHRITHEILDGKMGAKRNVVLLNSAAGLIAAGKASDFSEGIAVASQSIDSGSAKRTLSELVRFTND